MTLVSRILTKLDNAVTKLSDTATLVLGYLRAPSLRTRVRALEEDVSILMAIITEALAKRPKAKRPRKAGRPKGAKDKKPRKRSTKSERKGVRV